MKKFWLACARKICRLVVATLWQLVWFIPFCGLCWYGKVILPEMIQQQFNIEQTQERLVSLEKFAEAMKQNTSLSNPTALWHYVSAQLNRISVSVKLNTLEATCDMLQNLCIWTIYLLWILAIIYAIIRIIRAYRAKTQAYSVAVQVVHQIRPDILILQNEVAALRAELQSLKQSESSVAVSEKSLIPSVSNE